MKLTEKIRGTAADLAYLGSRAGERATLLGVIIVMAVMLVWNNYRFTDRWTATQARAAQVVHADEHSGLLEKINRNNVEILQRLSRMEAKMNGVSGY